MTTHHPASQIRRVAPRDLISDADMRDNSLLRMDGTLTREPRGGLEMLFSDQRHHSVTLPSEARNGHAADIAFLIDHLCDHVMKDTRKELFVLDGHIRPGVLVLINDADWELEGEEACCPNAEAGAIDSAIQPCDALVAVSSLPSDVLKRNAAAGENLAWSRERHPWITFSLAHPTSQGRTANQACDRNRGRGKSKTGVVFDGGGSPAANSLRADARLSDEMCFDKRSRRPVAAKPLVCFLRIHHPPPISAVDRNGTPAARRAKCADGHDDTACCKYHQVWPEASVCVVLYFLQSAAGVSDRLHLSSPALPGIACPASVLDVRPSTATFQTPEKDTGRVFPLRTPRGCARQGWDCPAARRASLTSSSLSASAASIHPASPPPLSLPSQWIIRLENPRPLLSTNHPPSIYWYLGLRASCRGAHPRHTFPPSSSQARPREKLPPCPRLWASRPPGSFVVQHGGHPGWLAGCCGSARPARRISNTTTSKRPPSSQGGVRPISDPNPHSLLAGFNAAAAAAGPGLPDEPSSILMIIPPRLHHPCFQPVGLLQVTCANAAHKEHTRTAVPGVLRPRRARQVLFFLAWQPQRQDSRPGSIHLHAPQRSGGGKARQANAPPRHFCAETEQYTLGGLVQRDFAVCH
ncbi:ubiquitin-related modifier 1 [Purpureocillium lilacinum]|uniref:Ubiquitin-related modifier 1 n=1 Tax=Purpureocillium lilacinum TaxID=33203 RepID=A0A2U3E534_PURLI|nr:ubiquitin-related modifier 1 [Purpureocillium lilacinum]